MSTPATETKPAEEQQVPKAEIKQEKETTTTSSEATASAGAEPSSMEVDASKTETKTEAASGGEEAKTDAAAKPAEGEGTKAEDAKAKPERKFRLNLSARKRFKWLLDQGYSKEEAAELAKEPLKTKELRDRFNADTRKGPKPKDEKVIEAEVKKLSPADKKRFSWLLQNGHTEEEALEVIQKKRSTAPKRNMQMSSSNNGPPMKMSRPQPVDGQPSALGMAVVPKNFPETTLTHAQSNEVKAAILKEVVQQKDSGTKPRFESCAHVKAGYLRVICSDGPTRQWLHKTVGKLTVPEGVPLKMVNEKNLLKGADVYTGVFPDSKKETNEAILEFVKSQNDGLDISKWKVLSRKEPPNKQLVELMFSVDPASSKTIEKLDSELNYKFNKVHLRKQAKPGDSQGPVANNRNNVARVGGAGGRPGGVGGRPMGTPQRRPVVNQPRPALNSFVPVWDSNRSNLPQQSNYNQFDSMRSNSYSSAGGNSWGTVNALSTLGLGNLGGSNGFGMDNNSYGGSNSFGGLDSFGTRSNSFGAGNNSFGGSNSFRSGNNSLERGSNSFGSSGTNLFSRRNGGGGQSGGSNRPFNLSDSLYDQLKLIGSSGALGNNSNGFGSSRRTGGGGGGGSANNGQQSRRSGGNNNSRARNSGNANGSGGKAASSRSNNLGKRNFFTTTRTGFF